MTPAQLHAACVQAGGVYALARMLGKRPKYLYRRINGEYPVSTMDELAILKALNVKSAAQLTREGEPS